MVGRMIDVFSFFNSTYGKEKDEILRSIYE